MSLVVDLGLERFEPLEAVDILRRLVEEGHTQLVREVFGGKVLEVAIDNPIPVVHPKPSKASKTAKKSKQTVDVPERRASSRWLSDRDARPILRDIAKLYKAHDTYASFSWGELEGLGAWNLQPLALVCDGPSDALGIQLGDTTLKVIDLEESAQNWRGTRGNVGLAAKLHILAMKHRLIVHSQ